jgi:hypothetical protein
MMVTKKSSDDQWDASLYAGCYRVYKERLEESKRDLHLKRVVDGVTYILVSPCRDPYSASSIVKDYKRCGFKAKVVHAHGIYGVFVHPTEKQVPGKSATPVKPVKVCKAECRSCRNIIKHAKIPHGNYGCFITLKDVKLDQKPCDTYLFGQSLR